MTEWAFLPGSSSLILLRAVTVTGLGRQTASSSDGPLQAALGLPPCHSLGLKLSRPTSSLLHLFSEPFSSPSQSPTSQQPHRPHTGLDSTRGHATRHHESLASVLVYRHRVAGLHSRAEKPSKAGHLPACNCAVASSCTSDKAQTPCPVGLGALTSMPAFCHTGHSSLPALLPPFSASGCCDSSPSHCPCCFLCLEHPPPRPRAPQTSVLLMLPSWRGLLHFSALC